MDQAPTRDVLMEWANDLAANGDVHWPQWRERLEDTRCLGAQLIGAPRKEIALIRNTTEGVNLSAAFVHLAGTAGALLLSVFAISTSLWSRQDSARPPSAPASASPRSLQSSAPW